MEYARRIIEKDDEVDIVIGLIVSTDFAKQVIPLIRYDLLSIPYARIVARWVVDYFQKYEKAPGPDIAVIFESEKQTLRDDSLINLISTFLQNLNEKYLDSESFNIDYAIDKAVKYLRLQAVENLSDKIRAAKLSGDVEAAEAAISTFKRIEKGAGTASSVWYDEEEAIRSIRGEDEIDHIVRFPGELGKLIRPLNSEDFIAFIAPPKRCKSFWLVELATLISLNRKNVLFITLEMPAAQLRLRIFQRITGMVVDAPAEGQREVIIPYFDHNFSINGTVHTRKEIREQISARAALKKMKDIQGFVKHDNFRIVAKPANSITPEDIRMILDNLERYEKFIPQAIIIDYADILATSKKSDHRNQINDKWEGVRSIGQERGMLMATVSHTNKETLYRDVRDSDVVEDIRKVNHVTMLIGVNKLQLDKEQGVQRLSVLDDRFADFNPMREAVVTQCLDIGGVYLDSRLQYKGTKTE